MSYQKAQVDVQRGDVDDDIVIANDSINRGGRSLWKRPVAWIAGSFLLVVSVLWNGLRSSAPKSPIHDQVSVLGESVEKMNTPLFYRHQRVNHFNAHDKRKWSNRYYKSTKYFEGAGHPIIIVVGGEGGLNHGMLYPFVTEVLAKNFGAAVLEIEHRFYGPYWPIKNPTNDDLLKLLNPHQALADMVQLTRHVRDTEFTDCSPHRTSPDYCPVITIGGSYPGFLSALFRFLYSDFVDMSYASAAPLLMYAQVSPPNVYYDIVTSAADRASPGCSAHVRLTLEEVMQSVDAADTLQDAADSVGICSNNLPSDSVQNKEDLKYTITTAVAYAFAEYNSGAYPPGEGTALYQACKVFQDPKLDTLQTIEAFFQSKMQNDDLMDRGCDLAWIHCEDPLPPPTATCFDIGSQDDDDAPSADGSNDMGMWNFQTCTNVIFLAGYSNTSLLPPMEATYEDLTLICQDQFGDEIIPHPTELVQKWNYVDGLKDQSYILFTNGMQDMWMGGSVTWNVSDTVLALNFENGAHHSDLSHQGPTDADTPDIKEGFKQIQTILGGWLDEIHAKQE